MSQKSLERRLDVWLGRMVGQAPEQVEPALRHPVPIQPLGLAQLTQGAPVAAQS